MSRGRLRNLVRSDNTKLTAVSSSVVNVSSSVSSSVGGILFVSGDVALTAARPKFIFVSQSQGTNGCTASLPAGTTGSLGLEFYIKDVAGHGALRNILVTGTLAASSNLFTIDGAPKVWINQNYGFLHIAWDNLRNKWVTLAVSGATDLTRY